MMNTNYPRIVLLHKLPNRIRVKFTLQLKNTSDFIKKLSEHEGVTNCRYNEITQNLVVNFDNHKIEIEELLIRIVILYAGEKSFIPIKIVSGLPKREIPALAFYSLGLIAAAGASSLFTKTRYIQDLLNWLAAGTTALSIVEHAKEEIDSKGAFDPEVISVMYLLNSVKKGNFVDSSAITWLTTYGRHFIDLNFEGVLLKVNKVVDQYTKETLYNVSTINEQDKNTSFMKVLVTKFIEKHSPHSKNNLMFTNNNMDLVKDKVFCGFRNECDKIVIKNRDCASLCY